MLIQVTYHDNRYDYVKEFILDKLIESREIVKFRRSSGWVILGIDPVRTGKREYNAKWSDELRTLVS